MPRVRIDLKPEAYEALAARAIEERRPVDWQAEVLIESGLGLRDRRTTSRPRTRPGGPIEPPSTDREATDAVA